MRQAHSALNVSRVNSALATRKRKQGRGAVPEGRRCWLPRVRKRACADKALDVVNYVG